MMSLCTKQPRFHHMYSSLPTRSTWPGGLSFCGRNPWAWLQRFPRSSLLPVPLMTLPIHRIAELQFCPLQALFWAPGQVHTSQLTLCLVFIQESRVCSSFLGKFCDFLNSFCHGLRLSISSGKRSLFPMRWTLSGGNATELFCTVIALWDENQQVDTRKTSKQQEPGRLHRKKYLISKNPE